MLENVVLQVAEVGCFNTQNALLHCAIFSATYLAVRLGTKDEKCAHAPLSKLREMLLEVWYAVHMCNSVDSCCNPLWKVELSSTSCNASCNKKITTHGRFPFDKIFEDSGCKPNGTRQLPGNIPENLGQPQKGVPKSGNTENFENSVFHLKVFSVQVPTELKSRHAENEMEVVVEPFQCSQCFFYLFWDRNLSSPQLCGPVIKR